MNLGIRTWTRELTDAEMSHVICCKDPDCAEPICREAAEDIIPIEP